jgi:hypothetical protein
MKTFSSLLVMAASLAAANLIAQNYPPVAAEPVTTPEPETVPALVYTTPVIYQAPVVYQAPVIYQAPVYYEMPVVYGALPVETAAPACQYPPPPTVVYFGGAYSDFNNGYHHGNACSPVIYFGRGESAQRGYQFNHPR